MDRDIISNANAIWEDRYDRGGHVGTAPVIADDPVDFTQHKFLYQHAIGGPMTGEMDGWAVDTLGRRFLRPPPERVLAIGSGMAFVEEHLLATGLAGHVVAYEMSQTACRAATERVAGKPYAGRLEMRCADILGENLPDASFDLVFVQAAIHHFFEIEEMFRLMHRVLRPGGLLWYDEYVGPDLHIYDDVVTDLIDRMNDCLEPRYRWNTLDGAHRETIGRPSLEFMLQHDPSEGVHASRILPLTYQYFDVFHRQDYAGAALRPFFTGILPNFDWSRDSDRTIGRLLILVEKLMAERAAIPNYQTVVLGRRRDEIRPPLTEAEAHRINWSDWKGLAPQAPPSAIPGDAPPLPLPRLLLRKARTLKRLILG